MKRFGTKLVTVPWWTSVPLVGVGLCIGISFQNYINAGGHLWLAALFSCVSTVLCTYGAMQFATWITRRSILKRGSLGLDFDPCDELNKRTELLEFTTKVIRDNMAMMAMMKAVSGTGPKGEPCKVCGKHHAPGEGPAEPAAESRAN